MTTLLPSRSTSICQGRVAVRFGSPLDVTAPLPSSGVKASRPPTMRAATANAATTRPLTIHTCFMQSKLVRRVDPIELADEGRPHEGAAHAASLHLHGLGHALHDG